MASKHWRGVLLGSWQRERERAASFVFLTTAGSTLGGLLHVLGLALWQIPLVMAVNAVSAVLVVGLLRQHLAKRTSDPPSPGR